jgi:polyisoprenoid-binding protein YceI
MTCITPLLTGLRGVMIIASLAAATPAVAADWKVDLTKSTLGFSGTQTGSPFKGHFSRYTAQIQFDPAHPETGHAHVSIDVASAVTGDPQRDGAMPGKDWFSVTQFPTATFDASGFRSTGTDTYEATGRLTLRGVTMPETLPFTLTIKDGLAHAVGRLQLIRSAFGVGQGPWSSGQWVALEVGVDVDLVASTAG